MASQNNEEFRPSSLEEDDAEILSPNANRRRNIKNLLSDGRSRSVIVFTAIVLVILFAIGYRALTKPKTSDRVGGDVSVSAPPTINRIPGSSNNLTLNRDIRDQNVEGSQSASQNGESYLPELHGNSDNTRTDPLLINPNPAPPASVIAPPTPVQVQPTPYVAAPSQQAPLLTQQQQQELNDARARAATLSQQRQQVFDQQMAFYLGKLRDNRSMIAQQEFNYTGQKKPIDKDKNDSNADGSSGSGGNSGDSSSVKVKPPALVQAGTIIPSVLITPANSDNPSPLLVDVTTGPFRGGRAICKAETHEETMAIHCTTLSLPSSSDIPGAGHSFKIDAYVVNDDYETNVATSVNHHYLHNIGLVAAAAFVQGYGQAVARSDSTVTTGPFGSTTTSYGQLSNSQINKAALGQVGQDVGQRIEAQGNRPTTVKAQPNHKGEGISVGLLFMSDF